MVRIQIGVGLAVAAFGGLGFLTEPALGWPVLALGLFIAATGGASRAGFRVRFYRVGVDTSREAASPQQRPAFIRAGRVRGLKLIRSVFRGPVDAIVAEDLSDVTAEDNIHDIRGATTVDPSKLLILLKLVDIRALGTGPAETDSLILSFQVINCLAQDVALLAVHGDLRFPGVAMSVVLAFTDPATTLTAQAPTQLQATASFTDAQLRRLEPIRADEEPAMQASLHLHPRSGEAIHVPTIYPGVLAIP